MVIYYDLHQWLVTCYNFRRPQLSVINYKTLQNFHKMRSKFKDFTNCCDGYKIPVSYNRSLHPILQNSKIEANIIFYKLAYLLTIIDEFQERNK